MDNLIERLRLIKGVQLTPYENDLVSEAADTIADLTRQRDALREALEDVLVGGNHLALFIGADHPSASTEHKVALEHYGSDRLDEYNAWCCWRAIMTTRQALADLDNNKKE